MVPAPMGLGDWLIRQLLFLLDSLSFFVKSDRIQRQPVSGPASSGQPGQSALVLKRMYLCTCGAGALWETEYLAGGRRWSICYEVILTSGRRWSQNGDSDWSVRTDG